MRNFIHVPSHAAWLHAACLLLPFLVAGAQPVQDLADSPPAQPLGGGGSGVLEPVPTPDPSRQPRKVYVCRESGVPVFTDRPCGPGAATHEIDFAATGAGRSASLAPQAPLASTRPRVEPAPARETVNVDQARCVALRERLADIDGKMRAGYSAREAARLWQRWRDTRAQLRARRC
jgi:hypothetical protein